MIRKLRGKVSTQEDLIRLYRCENLLQAQRISTQKQRIQSVEADRYQLRVEVVREKEEKKIELEREEEENRALSSRLKR